MSNVLTDAEIQEMRNRAKLNDNRQIDPMAFARSIEREVLEKMGKQDPVAVMHNNGMTSSKHEFSDIDTFLRSCRNNTPLYAHPLPAQAIPEQKPVFYYDPKLGCDSDLYNNDLFLDGRLSPLYSYPPTTNELSSNEWLPIDTAPIGVDLLVFDGLNQFAPAWGSEIKGGTIKWLFGTSQDCSPTHWRLLPDVSALSASPKQS